MVFPAPLSSPASPGQPPGLVLIGCGFVADLYMASLQTFPGLQILGAYDHNPERLQAFTSHWGLPGFASLDAALAPGRLVLNLTNPASHAEVSEASLTAGAHVFSEKPLVLNMEEARALHALAESQGLQLASAPSSVLGEAAQSFGKAIRDGLAGTPRLVYAELDDGFIPQAPFRDWISASGAAWPHADEFATGCTLEHAGYVLSWLIAWFGAVTRVTTTTATLLPEKPDTGESAPDLSVAMVEFADGPMLRLTCSIIAPHDHRLRLVGDAGVLELTEIWNNRARPRFRKRLSLRRRLMEHPVGKRLRLPGPTHPFVKRQGAAAMNFALGPAELAEAIAEGRPSRLAGDYALHLTEVTLACQRDGHHEMTTSCPAMEPMPWAR